jgi:hypothetical protein
MGRQVEFYMLPDDPAELEAEFKARGDVVFLAVRMPGPQPREEESLGPVPRDFGGRYLARRAELGQIRVDHVPEQNDYAIGAACSPVVEFSRSRLDPETGRLAPGRMYVTTSTWDRQTRIEAAPDFLKWAGQLFGAIRRGRNFSVLKEPSHKGIYISQRAAAWREQGGVLGW